MRAAQQGPPLGGCVAVVVWWLQGAAGGAEQVVWIGAPPHGWEGVGGVGLHCTELAGSAAVGGVLEGVCWGGWRWFVLEVLCYDLRCVVVSEIALKTSKKPPVLAGVHVSAQNVVISFCELNRHLLTIGHESRHTIGVAGGWQAHSGKPGCGEGHTKPKRCSVLYPTGLVTRLAGANVICKSYMQILYANLVWLNTFPCV